MDILQGDVGSGKTVVAVFAIYATITAGFQAALMVPTEILAQQHFAKVDELLRPLGVRVALLTGDTKELEKKELLLQLKGKENITLDGKKIMLYANNVARCSIITITT